MSLLVSAESFFVESLVNYEHQKYEFAILHAVTATELYLKCRLEKIHPSLVFEKIDCKLNSNSRTVAISFLPSRLANLGVVFDKNDLDIIDIMIKLRNEIVHYMPSHTRSDAERHLALLYDFIGRFLKKELGIEVFEILPTDLVKVASQLITQWRDLIQIAQEKALKAGNVVDIPCPMCGGEKIVSVKNKKANCHFCKNSLLHLKCKYCEDYFLVNQLTFPNGEENDSIICNKCGEDLYSSYIT